MTRNSGALSACCTTLISSSGREQHCVKAPELLREGGAEESIIHAVCSHGWAICVDIKPEHEMEKLLYAADELTGLIGAAALMRPSKSVPGHGAQEPEEEIQG